MPNASSASYTVLMTATIAPKAEASQGLQRRDPAVRLRDYEAALAFWLSLAEERIGGIVFAENTGYPLDGLKRFAAEHNPRGLEVEFLSFDYPAVGANISYGQPEFRLVGEALRRSAIAGRTTHVLKATGRYTFPGIRRLLARLPAAYDLAADCKGFRPGGQKADPIMPVALILFRRNFFLARMAPLVETMVPAPPWNRRQYVETVYFDAFYPLHGEPGLILRWPCNCEPRGIGSNGDNYGSLRKRFQGAARAIMRVLRPSLWI